MQEAKESTDSTKKISCNLSIHIFFVWCLYMELDFDRLEVEIPTHV